MAEYETIFNDSYARVNGRFGADAGFFQRFYEIFLDRSDGARAHFSGTDLGRQKRMVHESFAFMLGFAATRTSGDYLERIALRHGKSDLNISVDLYDEWLDALVETVRECDPRYDADVDAAWRIMLAPGVAFMKSFYDRD